MGWRSRGRGIRFDKVRDKVRDTGGDKGSRIGQTVEIGDGAAGGVRGRGVY